jgi:hypothetical protein
LGQFARSRIGTRFGPELAGQVTEVCVYGGMIHVVRGFTRQLQKYRKSLPDSRKDLRKLQLKCEALFNSLKMVWERTIIPCKVADQKT